MLKYVYLALSALGLVLTWYYNVQHIAAGQTMLDFILAPSLSFATQSLGLDLAIAATAGSIWIVVEGKRIGIKHAWAYVVAAIVIAFACAFPLFLFHREMKLRSNAR